jgi:ribulose-phosphate 3-epimerase
MKIYPSLISANMLHLQRTIDILDAHVDGYHLDIMDDHFVPNLTWGPLVVNAVATATKRTLWVHIMAEHVSSLVDRMIMPQNSLITFHVETAENALDLIKKIEGKNWKAGIAISPATPVENLKPLLGLVDHILVMSVNPGFSGQTFIMDTLKKAEYLKNEKEKNGHAFALAFDGGITTDNIATLATHHVEMAAVANAIFSHQDIAAAAQQLRIHLR